MIVLSKSRAVIAVIGPTGVGKTKLGISLAKYLDGEVISVDSLQCYKHAAVMTARPTKEEIETAPHHMVAYLEAHEEPHSDYTARALHQINEICGRGRLPILVGGSMTLTLPLLSSISEQGANIMVIALIPELENNDYCKTLETRVDDMVDMGLLDEVNELTLLKDQCLGEVNNTNGVWKSIGYPELEPFDRCPMDYPYRRLLYQTGLSQMKYNTLRYAQRQLDWIRKDLMPKMKQLGIEYMTLPVDVSGTNWTANVEKPAVCSASEFTFGRISPSLKPQEHSESPTICLFGGSFTGSDDRHILAARQLASQLHLRGAQLVYGGGTTGVMGAVASELVALSGPGAVCGIVPFALVKYEETKCSTSELAAYTGKFGRRKIVPDMHTRKSSMFRTVLNSGPGSGFVAMSGGYGTLEELLEIITWRQLGIHNQPVCVFNVAGYYDTLLLYFQQMLKEGFVSIADLDIVQQAQTAQEVMQSLSADSKKLLDKDWSWC